MINKTAAKSIAFQNKIIIVLKHFVRCLVISSCSKKNICNFPTMQILTSACAHFKEPESAFVEQMNMFEQHQTSLARSTWPLAKDSTSMRVYAYACNAAEIAGHPTVAIAIKASSAICKWSHCLDPKWHDLGRPHIVLSRTAMGEQSASQKSQLANSHRSHNIREELFVK